MFQLYKSKPTLKLLKNKFSLSLINVFVTLVQRIEIKKQHLGLRGR